MKTLTNGQHKHICWLSVMLHLHHTRLGHGMQHGLSSSADSRSWAVCLLWIRDDNNILRWEKGSRVVWLSVRQLLINWWQLLSTDDNGLSTDGCCSPRAEVVFCRWAADECVSSCSSTMNQKHTRHDLPMDKCVSTSALMCLVLCINYQPQPHSSWPTKGQWCLYQWTIVSLLVHQLSATSSD